MQHLLWCKYSEKLRAKHQTCLNALPRRKRIYVRQDKYSEKLRAKHQTCLNALPRHKRIYVRQDKYSEKPRAKGLARRCKRIYRPGPAIINQKYLNPAVPGNECLKLPESSAEKETPKSEQISGQEPHMEKIPDREKSPPLHPLPKAGT